MATVNKTWKNQSCGRFERKPGAVCKTGVSALTFCTDNSAIISLHVKWLPIDTEQQLIRCLLVPACDDIALRG
jgi:hypothetical protein